DVLLVGSEGGNVLGRADATSASGFQPSDVAGVQNAGLGTTGNYGGPTQTIPLVARSPAPRRGLAVGASVRRLPPDTAPPTATALPPPTPPTANPDAFSLGTARVLTVPAPGVLGNDVPGNAATTALTAALVTPPDASDGTLVLNADGSFTFTAAASFDGTATFTYTASDGAAVSAPATVTITGGAAVRLFAVGSGAGLGSVPM